MVVGGVPLPGVEEIEYRHTSSRQAATWEAIVALNADPAYGIKWWDGLTTPVTVDLQVGVTVLAPSADRPPPVTWKSIGLGDVDGVEFDPARGTLIVSGRDLSNRLLESRVPQNFPNQTVAGIASTIAARHGMTAVVDAKAKLPPVAAPQSSFTFGLPARTSESLAQAALASGVSGVLAGKATAPATLPGFLTSADVPQASSVTAGRNWGPSTTTSTVSQWGRSSSEWDLLSTLARDNGLDLWVDGTTIYMLPPVVATTEPYQIFYQPPSTGRPVQSGAGNIVLVQPTGTTAVQISATDLKMRRSYALAQDVEVHVTSFHSGTGNAISRVAKLKTQGPGGQTRIYTYARPDLTSAQTTALAQSLLLDITQHERRIDVRLPGDTLLNIRSLVRLTGTGTSFDQVYYPDIVEHRVSIKQGFHTHLMAKNFSSASVLTLGQQ